MRRISIPKRLTAALITSILTMLVLTVPAGAGVTWCRADPIVEIHGHRVQVLVGVPAGYEQYVNGPIKTRFDIPYGLTKKVIFTDAGFNGHGEVVTWGTMTNAVRLTVQLPVDQARLGAGVTVPVEVTINSPWGTHVIYGNHLNTQITVPLS